MGEIDKTKDQLTKELAQARKWIAELEATATASGKMSSLYYGLFENFVEAATDSFSMWDSKLNLTYINNATLKYHPAGTKKSDVIGKNIKELIPHCEKSGRYEKYKQVLDTSEPLVIEDFKADPKYGDTYLSIKVFKIVDGIGIISSDIAERKRTEEALKLSEEKLRAIFESISDSITVVDGNGNITELNEAAVKLFGCNSKEETFGMNALTFIVEEDQPAAIGKLQEGKPTKFAQYKYKRMDGSVFWGETSSGVLRDRSEAVTGFIGVIRDITERKRTEDTLRRSEERLRAYFENAPDAIFVYDFNGVFLDGNKKGEELTGYSKDELIGKNFIESGLFSEEYALKAMNAVLKDARGEAVEPEEYEITRKDGQKIYLEATSFVASSQWKGEVVGIARDISKRKQMEEKLCQSEEKLRRSFESIDDIIAVSDVEGKVIDVNESALHAYGYKREEIIGMSGFDLIAERYRDNSYHDMQETLRMGYREPKEYIMLAKDGTEFPTEVRASVLRDSQGEAVGMVAVLRDIRERKKIEGELEEYRNNLEKMVAQRTAELASAYEELRESEERLRGFFENMPDILYSHNTEGQFTDINKKALEISGYSRDEIIGRNVLETGILPPDQIEGVVEGLKGFEEGKSGYPYEVQLMKKNGDRIAVEAVSFPIKRKGVLEVMGIARDITERKRTEEALRESEEKLRIMFSSMADGVVVTDLEGKIKDLNEAQLRLFGYSKKEEIVGGNGFDFIAEKDYDTAMGDVARLVTKGSITGKTWLLKRRSGDEFPAECSVTLMRDTKGNPTNILAVLRDKTERKQMEDALKESEAKYRTLVEQSEQGICIIQDGRIVFANNALSKINGYSLKEMYAMSPDEFLLAVHPDDRETFVKRVESRLKGDKLIPRYEYRIIRKDGTERHLETYAKRITLRGKLAIQSTIVEITERKLWENKLKESKEELRFYLNQITKAQEEERGKIARELHDDTIQELIALARQLEDLTDKKIMPDEDRRGGRKKIEEAQQKVTAILKSIRRFTRDLRPSVLDDLGLVPALEWLTSDMSAQFKIPIDISIIGTEKKITPDAALAMFRVAQESLRNAGSHSKASQIQLNLKFTSKTVTLGIIDNGVGFTPPKQISRLTRHGKLGVAGMYERAQLIGATLSIKSKRNKGTIITLESPIK